MPKFTHDLTNAELVLELERVASERPHLRLTAEGLRTLARLIATETDRDVARITRLHAIGCLELMWRIDLDVARIENERKAS